MARSIISNPTMRRGDAGWPSDRRRACAAEEVALLPADDPLEVGLEHRGRVVDVVAVEAHGGLEAQRVAGAEAGRDDVLVPARLENRVPDRDGLLRRHEHLEAVLAGVAGPRDGAAHAGDLAVGEPVVLDARQVHVAQRLQHLARERALQGDQRVARAGVHRGDVEAPGLLDDPGEVLLDVRRVDDEQEVVRRRTGTPACRRRTCPAGVVRPE